MFRNKTICQKKIPVLKMFVSGVPSKVLLILTLTQCNGRSADAVQVASANALSNNGYGYSNFTNRTKTTPAKASLILETTAISPSSPIYNASVGKSQSVAVRNKLLVQSSEIGRVSIKTLKVKVNNTIKPRTPVKTIPFLDDSWDLPEDLITKRVEQFSLAATTLEQSIKLAFEAAINIAKATPSQPRPRSDIRISIASVDKVEPVSVGKRLQQSTSNKSGVSAKTTSLPKTNAIKPRSIVTNLPRDMIADRVELSTSVAHTIETNVNNISQAGKQLTSPKRSHPILNSDLLTSNATVKQDKLVPAETTRLQSSSNSRKVTGKNKTVQINNSVKPTTTSKAIPFLDDSWDLPEEMISKRIESSSPPATTVEAANKIVEPIQSRLSSDLSSSNATVKKHKQVTGETTQPLPQSSSHFSQVTGKPKTVQITNSAKPTTTSKVIPFLDDSWDLPEEMISTRIESSSPPATTVEAASKIVELTPIQSHLSSELSSSNATVKKHKQVPGETTPPLEQSFSNFSQVTGKNKTVQINNSVKPKTTSKAIPFLDDSWDLPEEMISKRIESSSSPATTVEAANKIVNQTPIQPHLSSDLSSSNAIEPLLERNKIREKRTQTEGSVIHLNTTNPILDNDGVDRIIIAKELVSPQNWTLVKTLPESEDDGSGDISTQIVDITMDLITDGDGTTTLPTTSHSNTTTLPTTSHSNTTTLPTTSHSNTTTLPTTSHSSSTTLPITSTTESAISETQPPNLDVAPPFVMDFSLSMNGNWNDTLSDTSSPEFEKLAREVETVVNNAFAKCPGFLPNSTIVKEFRQGSIISIYNVSFESQTVMEQGDEIVVYVDEVEKILKNSTINGMAVTPENMTAASNNQINDLNENPCTHLTDAICDPCYSCHSVSSQVVPNCLYKCDMTTRRCTIVDNTGDIAETSCICMDNYLPVGGECVHENLIIGVSVGIGAAIILGLVIAVIILGCKKNKKEEGVEEDDGLQVETGEKSGEDGTINEQYIEISPDPEAEGSSHPTTQAGSATLAAAAAVAEAPVVMPQVTRAVVDPPVQQAAAADTAPVSQEILGDYSNEDYFASSEALRQSQAYDFHRRAYFPQLTVHGEDDALPREITQSESYRTFVPRLDNIDQNKEYSIQRPRMRHDGPSSSDRASGYSTVFF